MKNVVNNTKYFTSVRRIWGGAIFLTLFVDILCLPLRTDCDYVSFLGPLLAKRSDLTFCTGARLPKVNLSIFEQRRNLSYALGFTP